MTVGHRYILKIGKQSEREKFRIDKEISDVIIGMHMWTLRVVINNSVEDKPTSMPPRIPLA